MARVGVVGEFRTVHYTKWWRHTCLSTAMNPHAERRNAIAESGLSLLKRHARAQYLRAAPARRNARVQARRARAHPFQVAGTRCKRLERGGMRGESVEVARAMAAAVRAAAG